MKDFRIGEKVWTLQPEVYPLTKNTKWFISRSKVEITEVWTRQSNGKQRISTSTDATIEYSGEESFFHRTRKAAKLACDAKAERR